MPFTIQAPATAQPGKPWSLGLQRSTSGERCRTGRKHRQLGRSLAVSLPGTYTKPWRNTGTEGTAPSLANMLRQLVRQSSFSKSFSKAENRPVWHGVDLQQDSKTQSASACNDAAAVASAALRIQNPQLLQGVLNCLVLAETVYRVSGENHDEIAGVVSALRNDFPGPSVSLDQLQWSLPHAAHRYMLAEDADALYVCFIGTKQRRDIVTNANIMQDVLWPDLSWNSPDLPAAHAGFLNRARDVPIQDIYKLARQRNKRLVLTGHSLGGAVALLCMLDLLYHLADEAIPNLSCIGFATPAVGNAALAEFVRHKGWDKLITNYLVPEDVITRLLPSAAAQAVTEAADAAIAPTAAPAAATQEAGPAHPALWASLARQSSSSSPPSPSPSSSQSSSPSSVLPPSPWDTADMAAVPSSSSKPIWEASEASSSHGSGSSSSSSLGSNPSSSSPSLDEESQAVHAGRKPALPPRFRPSVRLASSQQYRSQGRWQAFQRPAKQLQHNYLEQSAPSLVLAVKPVALNSNNIVPLQARALGSSDGKPASLLTSSLVHRHGDSSDRTAQQTNIACTTSDQAQPTLENLDRSPSSIQQQTQWRSNSNLNPSLGIWTRTAQLARLVSFPVRATRAYYSYVPFGQQLYLNPQAVATSLEEPIHSKSAAATSATVASAAVATAATAEPATAATAVATAQHPCNSNGEAGAAPAALGDLLDVVVQQRREQLGRLWMHRMPTYRARFQQILFAALGLPLPHGSQTKSSQAEAVTLSKPIAPVIHVIKAETSCKALTSQHLKGILQDGMNALPTFRWFWIWSGAWPAIRQRLYSREQDTELIIAIQGHGLEHATHTHVTFGTETLPCAVAQQPQAAPWGVTWGPTPKPTWLSRAGGGPSALQAVFAMLLMTKPAVHMALRVSVPARVMRKMQQQMAATGTVGVEVTMQSDFCSSTAPVLVQSDVKALQDRFAGMLAVCRLVSAKQQEGNDRLA